MHQSGPELVLSATDLSNFLGCRHRTALDMAVAVGAQKKPWLPHDPLLDVLWQRGAEHEKRYVESLRAEGSEVVELPFELAPDVRVAQTLDAMRAGTAVIVQGGLRDGRWFGKPDVMRRVATASALGEWSYEIADTKLSRETRAGTLLQLGLYSEMLERAQGARPERFYVVTPEREHPYRVDDYAAYFRFIRDRMLVTVARPHDDVAAEHYPDPVDACEICRWNAQCKARRRADDHLALVAGIARVQRQELTSRAIATVAALAALPLPLVFEPRLKRGSVDAYLRVREQARVQVESRDLDVPLRELLEVKANEGLCRLPAPSEGDLFLDLEGDPFVGEGGREYLFGIATSDGGYESLWALSEADERRAFERVIDRIVGAARAHPGMHVYHYAPYEPAAFKRLMGRYATRERELDAMLREGRFVDLYAVVRQGLRAGVERYSIKNLEPLYAFTRSVALRDANRCLKLMEQQLELDASDGIAPEIRDVVEGYNRDDCVSTLRLRDWLETQRTELIATGIDVPRRVLAESDAPDGVDEKALRVEALRARLLDGVPDLLADRDADQQGRWLLAYLLDYHRREGKATWWEYYRLRELPEPDLIDEREAVASMTFVESVLKVKRSFVHRYSYPPQEMELDAGDELRLQDGSSFGKVHAVDRVRHTIDILKGPALLSRHPAAVFAFKFVSCDPMEGALLRLGEIVASGAQRHRAARSLLANEPPRLRDVAFSAHVGERPSEFAVRIGRALNETVLAIQGPPGAGKTYCGARMICDLVRERKRVGVTANSHKAIRLLLDTVAAQAAKEGLVLRIGHKNGDEADVHASTTIAHYAENADARQALADGAVDVVGGTAWLWSREDFASAVDVLFVDEAGQMALANVVAVSQAADSVVLLGDPQQLEQPRKGSHPDGVDVSALQHILGAHQTIPKERGIFLEETWRLAPKICDFTSELFYEGRLEPKETLARQRVDGVNGLPAHGLAIVPVAHEGNRNHSPEEIEAIASLIATLTREGVTWTDRDGITTPMHGSDILVVSPYNAQVSRLAERLEGTGVRIGTVDKFQGQEAPVVIYSMASSSPEDAPRGMEFLYNLNRLNVATSRAKCLAIIVASPALFEPECRSPRQMLLANALCRFREMVTGA